MLRQASRRLAFVAQRARAYVRGNPSSNSSSGGSSGGNSAGRKGSEQEPPWLHTFPRGSEGSSRQQTFGRGFGGHKEYKYFDNSNRPSPPGHGPRRFYVLGGVVGLGGLYYVTHLDVVQETGRRRFLCTTTEEERRAGEQSLQQLEVQFRGKFLHPNHSVALKVREIGTRIIRAAGGNVADWHFHVVESHQANCFVLPNNHVFVFTGVLPIMYDDDGMAAVLGHEIGHQIARHSGEKLSLFKIVLVAEFLLHLLFDAPPQLMRVISTVAMELPNSRSMEVEADRIGMMLAAKSCYNPEAAISVFSRFEKLHEASGDKQLRYLSTHPSDRERIENLKSWLPEANRVWEKHCDRFY